MNTSGTSTSPDTGSTSGAKQHARSQAASPTDAMPIIPAARWPTPPAGVLAEQMTWAETVPGGSYSTKVLARGTRIRLTDLSGTGCAHLLLWRADAPWERLSVADTVKVPWQAYLGKGHPLLSDQGRVLATIIADESGHHDALCGTTTLAANISKYGAGQIFSQSPGGRELLLLAAAKQGLGRADVAPSLSLFHGVTVSADGSLISTGSAGPGKSVDLLLHLPTVIAIANTAHPLDPAPHFKCGSLQILAWRAHDDLARLLATVDQKDPEYQRAVNNSEDTFAALSHTDR